MNTPTKVKQDHEEGVLDGNDLLPFLAATPTDPSGLPLMQKSDNDVVISMRDKTYKAVIVKSVNVIKTMRAQDTKDEVNKMIWEREVTKAMNQLKSDTRGRLLWNVRSGKGQAPYIGYSCIEDDREVFKSKLHFVF